MTVDELSIKITADSDNFVNGMTNAIKVLGQLRTYARTAGNEVRSAFKGLIDVETEVSGGNTKNDSGSVTIPQFPSFIRRNAQKNTSSESAAKNAVQSVTEVQNFKNANLRTANVLSLDPEDTVVGAVSGSLRDSGRPIEITTSVELDGDRIGESVNRYFMSRDRITNGLDR